jgi:hypothetical protein
MACSADSVVDALTELVPLVGLAVTVVPALAAATIRHIINIPMKAVNIFIITPFVYDSQEPT